MPAPKANAVRAFAIADARSVLKAVKKHWARLKSRGATDAQVKQYEELIAAAQRAEAAVRVQPHKAKKASKEPAPKAKTAGAEAAGL